MGQPVEGRAAGPAEPDVLAEPAKRGAQRDDPGTSTRSLPQQPGARPGSARPGRARPAGAHRAGARPAGTRPADASPSSAGPPGASPPGAGPPGPSPAGARTEPQQRPSRGAGALLAFGGRHWIIAILLAAAAALRAAAMLGYRPALWFNDSFQYVSDAVTRMPGTERPSGYSLFLVLLQPLHSFEAVMLVQHLMGLASGLMIYAVLRRRGLPDWGACLAALPVLFDAYEVQLEHLVMSDILFTFLVTAAVCLLCWRDRPSVVTAVVAGLLTGAAALVRTVGLPLLAVVAVCLLIRRTGWRQVVAGLVAGVLPVLAYAVWFHSAYGKFALTESDGPFLYSRVMAFAECSKVKPPKDLQVLCDPRPPANRPSTPEYPWTVGNPLYNVSRAPFTPEPSHMAGRFALLAIERQPLDYLRVTAVDTARTFDWTRSPNYPDPQTAAQYQFGMSAQPIPNWANFSKERMYQPTGKLSTTVAAPYARALVVYMRYFYLRGAILGAILLIGAAWAVYGRRRGAPGLLPWCVAAALIVEPAATAGFSYRYVLAAVPAACLAGGLAFVRSRPASTKPAVTAAPQPGHAA